MSDLSDQQLLRNYVERRCESAFSELVRRHVDLVYSAAVRMLRDAQEAEDVTQGTFIALAKSARHLTNRPVLSGWLHVAAQNLATKAIRSNARRRVREQEAATMHDLHKEDHAGWELIATHLDAALRELNETDRDALMLRYFERKPAHEIALILGLSDEAAQKRVSRAIERLREDFCKRGVTTAGSALALGMFSHAVQAAPAGLAASLSTAALATIPTATGIVTSVKIMAATKLKIGVISAVILASAITSVLIQHNSEAKARVVEKELRQQALELQQSRSENARLLDLAALAAQPSLNDQAELQRLRSKVAALRQQTNRVANLRDEAGRLRDSLNSVRREAQDMTQPTVRSEQAETRTRYSMQLALAAIEYASDHGDQFPTNLAQATNYISGQSKGTADLNFDQFEIAYTGSRAALSKFAHPGLLILIRQKQPWKNTDGKWAKAYAFTDGAGAIISVLNNDFDAWEKQRSVPPETPNQ